MKLYILRHGKAEASRGNDSERALSSEGVAEIQLLGAKLKQDGIFFDRVFVSPYKRTQQTFRHLKNHTGFDNPAMNDERLTPESAAPKALDILRNLGNDKTVLFISHQPVVSSLIALLVDNQIDHGHYYPMLPGSFAELDVFASEPGCAMLKSVLNPPFYHAN